MIRKASLDDIDAVKCIADANRDSIGFVLRPALIEAIERSWLIISEYDGEIVGFCNYRHCRNGRTTIYEICVRADMRRHGIGYQLIEYLILESYEKNQIYIQLKCTLENPANAFYQRLTFQLEGRDEGRKRPLNIWRFVISEVIV